MRGQSRFAVYPYCYSLDVLFSLKWIDTASKFGHGRFQTHAEKASFLGTLKKDLATK